MKLIKMILPLLLALSLTPVQAQVATYNPSASGVVKNVGGQTPDTAGNVAVTKTKFAGIVIPVFKSINGFDNLGASLPGTAFALGSGGGIVSSSGGTTASGYRYLPRAIDDARVTRTDWLIDWDTTESTASITVGVGLSTGTAVVNIANSGGNVVATLYNVSGSTVTTTGALSGRVSLSVSIATANGGLTESVSILGTPASLGNSNAWRVPAIQYQRLPAAALDVAYFATNCTSSRIVGWLHNANSLDGDPSGSLLTQTCIEHMSGASFMSGSSPNVENESLIIIPPRSLLSTPLKSVMFFHGRTETFLSLMDLSLAIDYGETIRQLLSQGYGYIACTGGQSNTNQWADWWGDPSGLARCKALYDAWVTNITNPGKLYGIGWSMGGVCALNWAKQYPSTMACMELNTPVTDLEDSAATYGVQVNATLKASVNLAYQCYWVSQASSNTGNTPNADNGTHWIRASQPGALPDIGMRGYQVTTVGTAATANTAVPLTSAANIPVGSYIYFRAARQMARVVYRSTGVPNTVNLDRPVTVALNDLVCLVPVGPNGLPDETAFDFLWWQNYNAQYAAGTTYVLGQWISAPTAHPELDVRPWNPARYPECFNLPIRIGVAGDGTSTGNDGILANAMMFAFQTAVNAIYPGMVTMYVGSGAHLNGQTPTDTINFFNAH